jgi:RNA polymerase sigma factor (sigma-70 family)
MGRSQAEWVEKLFSEYEIALQAFFRRRVRTPQEVPDLAQEVYLRLLRVSDVDAVRDPEAYLFTIAANLIKERAVFVRRQGLSVEISDSFADELVAETRSPDLDMDHAVCERRLTTVLAELSPKCRAAVVLQYRDGLTYAQIGVRLKVSSNMVKKYLSYALAHCRRRMRTWG